MTYHGKLLKVFGWPRLDGKAEAPRSLPDTQAGVNITADLESRVRLVQCQNRLDVHSPEIPPLPNHPSQSF